MPAAAERCRRVERQAPEKPKPRASSSTTSATVTLGCYVGGRIEQAIASRPFHPGPLPHLDPIEPLWGVMHQNVTLERLACFGH
jgi:hypothetical protein